MSKILKRQYREDRKAFRQDLYEVMKDDMTLALLMQLVKIASKDKSLLYQVFEITGFNHPAAYREICNEGIPSKITCGSYDKVFRNLYFTHRELYDKYSDKIPEVYALGDAYSVALAVFKRYQAIH